MRRTFPKPDERYSDLRRECHRLTGLAGIIGRHEPAEALVLIGSRIAIKYAEITSLTVTGKANQAEISRLLTRNADLSTIIAGLNMVIKRLARVQAGKPFTRKCSMPIRKSQK